MPTARRFVPLALVGLLVGLPFLAEGIRNPPTLEEARTIGQESPTVTRLMAQGTLQSMDISHVSLVFGREYKDGGAGPGTLVRETGFWDLHWQFRVTQTTVLVEQFISDRSGHLLWEDVREL